jgi:hypothetical protein
MDSSGLPDLKPANDMGVMTLRVTWRRSGDLGQGAASYDRRGAAQELTSLTQ